MQSVSTQEYEIRDIQCSSVFSNSIGVLLSCCLSSQSASTVLLFPSCWHTCNSRILYNLHTIQNGHNPAQESIRLGIHTLIAISTFSTLFVCCLFSWRYNPLWLYFSHPGSGLQPPRFRGFLITHNDAPQSIGLPWTSDQSVAETSTRQHTTLTTDKHPCPGWVSNPRSQQASGRRPTSQTARPLGPAATGISQRNQEERTLSKNFYSM